MSVLVHEVLWDAWAWVGCLPRTGDREGQARIPVFITVTLKTDGVGGLACGPCSGRFEVMTAPSGTGRCRTQVFGYDGEIENPSTQWSPAGSTGS